MSTRAISILIKSILGVFVVLTGTTFWYYTLGRKPKLAASVVLPEKLGNSSVHQIAPGELLLVAKDKATLYNMARGGAKWSVTLKPEAPAVRPAPAAPPPPPKTTPAPATKSAPSREKSDELEEQQVKRRFAKLEQWAAKLNERRGKLKSPLQTEAFNEEAKRYHAELTAARVQAAGVRPAQPPPPALPAETRDDDERPIFYAGYDSYFEKCDAVAGEGGIFLVRGARVLLLDRANGAVKKEFSLAGTAQETMRGPGCVYVVSAGNDGQREVTRFGLADGAQRAVKLTGPAPRPRFIWSQIEGQPPEPSVERTRTEVQASGGALVQMEVTLVQEKVTTHTVVSADAPSAFEEADKQTKGGWAADAAVVAQALEKDANREATGGKERVDESTYEVVLTRPFETGVAEVRVQMQGRPEIFSTASLDLLTAGRTLLAFDHTNKKVWEAKLAYSVSDAGSPRGFDDDASAGSAQPCVEAGGQLFFFDRGYLSAFQIGNGQTLWRLPSIGIRKVQHDGRGTLYVHTANRAPASLGHPDGGGVADTTATLPLTLKIDAGKGKILWKLEKYDACIVSNGQLYATRETRNAEDAVNGVFDRSKAIQCRFKLYKLSTRDGEPQWEWFQTRRPAAIEADGRHVALLFTDELQLLKSIAL